MDTVAIYCRLSKEDKDKSDESQSIQNQKKLLKQKAEQEGWIIFDFYIDEDYSGSDRERPEFNRLIKDAQTKKFNIVLCKTQSRLARDNRIIQEYVHEKFIDWKIRFVSIVDGIDTKSMVDKLNSSVIAVIDEYMLDTLSQNIKTVLRQKKEEGQFTGSMPPFGYKKDSNDKNHLVIDEEAALTVKLLFEMVADGHTYMEIADRLNSTGVLTPKRYKESAGYHAANMYNKLGNTTGMWSRDMVRSFLKNEVYIGNMVQGRSRVVNYRTKKKEQTNKKDWIRVANTHEPIISRELWDTVQNIISNRRRACKTHSYTKNVLSGKVFCLECGSRFYKSKSGEIDYFACHAARGIGGNICTNNSRIRTDALEGIILSKINEVITAYYDSRIIEAKIKIANGFEEKLEFYNKKRSKLEKDYAVKKRVLMTAYEDKANGVLEPEIFAEIQKDYSEFTQSYHAGVIECDNELAAINAKVNDIKSREKLLLSYKQLDRLTVLAVDEFIDKIHIGKFDRKTKTREIIIDFAV